MEVPVFFSNDLNFRCRLWLCERFLGTASDGKRLNLFADVRKYDRISIAYLFCRLMIQEIFIQPGMAIALGLEWLWARHHVPNYLWSRHKTHD